MTTKPYSELLEQVEALAGATLATAERSRVKIFANRRARHAHRECPYWPRFLRVGEERIVSDTGLLPLAQTGLDTIDQIIRIHAQDPFKQDAAFEYTEYYHDSTGIQITGYQAASTGDTGFTVDLSATPYSTSSGNYIYQGLHGSFPYYTAYSGTSLIGALFVSDPVLDPTIFDSYESKWFFSSVWPNPSIGDLLLRTYDTEPTATPNLVISGGWTRLPGTDAYSVGFSDYTAYAAYITYIAAPADTYGDGEGEESDVPSEWFEYMAQGAYADWLRSDGQTEKALAEEVIAEKLLNQQLEKVSRQNGNQVITRQLSHGNMQWR